MHKYITITINEKEAMNLSGSGGRTWKRLKGGKEGNYAITF